MDPRPQELATESMVSEYQGAPLTHNERVAREVSNRANNEEWRQGLALLTEQKEKADMKTSEVSTLIGRFGTDVEVGKSEDFKPEDDDDQGRLELTTEETDLQRRANEADQLLVAINEKGFDGLNIGEQRRAREMARDALGKHKGLSERFYALPAREQQQYLSDLLRNPQASAEMIKLYNEIGEGRALSNEGIFTAMEQYEKVMTEDKILSEQVAEVQRRYSQVEIRLNEFNAGGKKRDKIDTLSSTVSENQAKITEFDERIKSLNDLLGQVNSNISQRDNTHQLAVSRAAIGGVAGVSAPDTKNLEDQRGQLMKDIQELQQKRMTARKKVQELEMLKQEEQELKQSESELRLERDEISLKRAKTLQEIRSARRNLVEAQNVKLSIEKGVVGDLESVIGKASDRVILSQLINRTNYTEEELEELKQAAQTEIGKSLQDTLPSAWVERTTQNFGIIRRRARDVEIVRTDWIEGDFLSLMTEGPDAMIRRVISRTQKPGGGAYTAEEVDDYVSGGIPKELSQVAIDRILFWKYNNTGFGRVDIDSIASSPWGAEWYQKAVDKTESAQQELESVEADGAVNNTNYRDRLGQIAGSRSRIGSVLFSPIWAIMAMRQPHLYRQRPAPAPAGATP